MVKSFLVIERDHFRMMFSAQVLVRLQKVSSISIKLRKVMTCSESKFLISENPEGDLTLSMTSIYE